VGHAIVVTVPSCTCDCHDEWQKPEGGNEPSTSKTGSMLGKFVSRSEGQGRGEGVLVGVVTATSYASSSERRCRRSCNTHARDQSWRDAARTRDCGSCGVHRRFRDVRVPETHRCGGVRAAGAIGGFAPDTRAYFSASTSYVHDWIGDSSTTKRQHVDAKLTSRVSNIDPTGFVSYDDADGAELSSVSVAVPERFEPRCQYRQPDGHPYIDQAGLSLRLARAAQEFVRLRRRSSRGRRSCRSPAIGNPTLKDRALARRGLDTLRADVLAGTLLQVSYVIAPSAAGIPRRPARRRVRPTPPTCSTRSLRTPLSARRVVRYVRPE
jgi:hypothetical protein